MILVTDPQQRRSTAGVIKASGTTWLIDISARTFAPRVWAFSVFAPCAVAAAKTSTNDRVELKSCLHRTPSLNSPTLGSISAITDEVLLAEVRARRQAGPLDVVDPILDLIPSQVKAGRGNTSKAGHRVARS